jgi:hypothetical protein
VPRLVRPWESDEEFALWRNELIARARRGARAYSREIEAAGEWLDAEYTEERIRTSLIERHRLAAEAMEGQPDLGGDIPPPAGGLGQPEPLGDHLRGHRLEAAIVDLTAMHSKAKFSLIGPNQPNRRRRQSAFRAVVVTGCVVDPDAQDWLTGVTDLAACTWEEESQAQPCVRGRSDVAARWGEEALRLLEAALATLGWEEAESAATESRVEVDWPGAGTWTFMKLAEALGCSRDGLRRLARGVGIPRGSRGRAFTKGELDSMLQEMQTRPEPVWVDGAKKLAEILSGGSSDPA